LKKKRGSGQIMHTDPQVCGPLKGECPCRVLVTTTHIMLVALKLHLTASIRRPPPLFFFFFFFFFLIIEVKVWLQKHLDRIAS
jgi:hypothetical protein